MPDASIPALETAPALTIVWRDLAGRLMELCRVTPQLLDRVTRAPKSAFHAYCAFFAATLDVPAAVIARKAYDSDPKHLLAEALGDGISVAPVWRLLQKLEADHALPSTTYQQIADFARPPLLGNLMRVQSLDEQALDAFEMLKDFIAPEEEEDDEHEYRDLLVAAAPGIMPMTSYNVARTREALRMLYKFELADEELRARLGKCRNIDQLQRAFTTAAQKLRLPDLGIDFGPHLRRFETVADLRRAGRRYRNCLAKLNPHLIANFLSGESYLLDFTRAGEPCALVTLKIISPVVRPIWVQIYAVNGPMNKKPDHSVNKELRAALRSVSGIRFFEDDLAGSLLPIMCTYDEDDDCDD